MVSARRVLFFLTILAGWLPIAAPRAAATSAGPVSEAYLIITREALAGEFERLAAFHTSRGVPTAVQTVEWIQANCPSGRDLPETIRQYVQALHAQGGLEYLLLGGDVEIVPTRFVQSLYYPPGGATMIPTDLYFACLDGDWDGNGNGVFAEPYVNIMRPGDEADLEAELAVGRAPARDAAEAAMFVDKVRGYMEPEGETFWLGSALLAAEVLFPYDYTPGDVIYTDGAAWAQGIVDGTLSPCTSLSVTRLYEARQLWPGSLPETRASFLDLLNAGLQGVVVHIGIGDRDQMSTGDAYFTAADADALVNAGRPFLLHAAGNSAAAFDSTCILERLVRNPHGGAVACVGMPRENFVTSFDRFQQEFFHALYCTPGITLGHAVLQARLPSLSNVRLNTADRWTTLSYALLGDPALVVWQSIPDPVPAFLAAFDARALEAAVALRWAVSGLAGEFRLSGQRGGAAWAVPFAASGDGDFSARDTAPVLAAGGSVTYTLEHRASLSEAWSVLASRTVDLGAPARPVTLLEPFPNPFNPTVSAAFVLAQPQLARLCVYDLAGRHVATLADGAFGAGRQDVVWRGLDDSGATVPSGIYLLRLESELGSAMRRVTLLR